MKRLICFLIISSFIWGCEEVLDLKPENSLTFKNALTSEKEIESVLANAGAKARELDADYYIRSEVGHYYDEINQYGEDQFSLKIVSTYTWTKEYLIINRANIVLNAVDAMDIGKDRRDFYKGQCYFYKAFAYWCLLMRFGDCVIIKDDIEIEPVAKSPWTQVADYAIQLASNAAALLPEYDKVKNSGGESPFYKSVPCKGAANALLAYLCAWKAGGKYFAQPAERDYDEVDLWKRAEQACTEIISSGVYELSATPEAMCREVFMEHGREVIYEHVYRECWDEIKAEQYESSPFYAAASISNWPVNPKYSPGSIIYNKLKIYAQTVKKWFPEGDLRRESYFFKLDSMSHDTLLSITGGFAYPYKWRNVMVGTSGVFEGVVLNLDVNKVYWRLADIYLLRAECRARLGREYTEGAIADLNKVRQRANAKQYTSSEYNGDLRYAIFKEREKELYWEGYRYFDVIRNGYVRTELPDAYQRASDQDYIDGCFFFPLTEKCFDRNPLLRQNTYWLGKM